MIFYFSHFNVNERILKWLRTPLSGQSLFLSRIFFHYSCFPKGIEHYIEVRKNGEKRARAHAVWPEQCSTRRSLVWKCSWTRGKDANERTWKTIVRVRTLSRPFLRRFPTVVFNAPSLAVPPTSTRPSLPIAPSENCHAARARALGFIDTFNICSRSLCYSSPDVNNNRASHPWYPG